MQVLIILKFWILLILNYNLKDSESAIKNKLIGLLSKLRDFKFLATLVLEILFKKKKKNVVKTKYSIFYRNLKAETIINESDIDDVFGSICIVIISNIQNNLWKGSSWTIDSVIDHIINISKYNPLAELYQITKRIKSLKKD